MKIAVFEVGRLPITTRTMIIIMINE